ncbi:hypothetical protein [Streptomyces sp. NPDC091212]|uniref:hypothetical protein n=1 Tax=Streptomyces sp. NPDC091212 TaxID=3155191 RepID=UPI00343C94C4
MSTTARHADGTPCTHRVTPSGKPTEVDCSGRHDYAATCACGGWESTGTVKAALRYSHDSHRREAERAETSRA